MGNCVRPPAKTKGYTVYIKPDRRGVTVELQRDTIPAKGRAEATIGSYENHPLLTATIGSLLFGSYENHPLPDTTYVNNDMIKPPAAPVNNYQNIADHDPERAMPTADHSLLHYVEITSTTTNSEVPPKLERQYLDIDYSATMAVETQLKTRDHNHK